MGIFKIGKQIKEIADKGLDLADQAIVDKDKIAELKGHLEELKYKADEAARRMYETELTQIKGPFINFLRAIVRPFWGIMTGFIFGFECFTIIFGWWMYYQKHIEIEPLVLPGPVHVIITIVCGFYFGGRVYEKVTGNKFFEKWGI